MSRATCCNHQVQDHQRVGNRQRPPGGSEEFCGSDFVFSDSWSSDKELDLRFITLIDLLICGRLFLFIYSFIGGIRFREPASPPKNIENLFFFIFLYKLQDRRCYTLDNIYTVHYLIEFSDQSSYGPKQSCKQRFNPALVAVISRATNNADLD